MNEIEQMFYDAWCRYDDPENIQFQVPIGIYVVDFLLPVDKVIIEIDGHEYHKTKEQRERDYIRERYFIRQGFQTIRFMGTEVFLHTQKCVEEVCDLTAIICEGRLNFYDVGVKHGKESILSSARCGEV